MLFTILRVRLRILPHDGMVMHWKINLQKERAEKQSNLVSPLTQLHFLNDFTKPHALTLKS